MTSDKAINPQDSRLTPDELRGIWRRRRIPVLVTAGAVLLVTALLALLWPPSFESRATILIEQQDIPQDLVRTTVTGFADQRLQLINQRVMSTQNLLQIAERFDLYPGRREGLAREELVERIRSNVDFRIISADVVDPRRGVATRAAIAFSVSFSDRSPTSAYRVANELVSLYLDENLRNRSRMAEETTTFLNEESRRLEREVDVLERELADFKQAHVDELPELLQANWQLLNRASDEARDIKRALTTVDGRILVLESRLAQLDPHGGAVNSVGTPIMSPGERLAALRAQRVQLQGRYLDDHPDMIRMNQEIASLESVAGAREGLRDLAATLEARRLDLAAIQDRYSDDHPDVVLLNSQIRALSEGLDGYVDSPTVDIDPTSPSYIQQLVALESARLERDGLVERMRDSERKAQELERRVGATPAIEREYRELTRRYRSAAIKLADIQAKELEARIAESLESGRKGERLTLVDPPQAPEQPVSPNRALIVLLGSVLALGLAVGLAAVLEALEQRVYGARPIAEVFGLAPLGAIPEIRFDEQGAVLLNRLPVLAIVGGLAAVAVSLLHFAFVPLDTLFYMLLARLRG